MKPYKSTGKLLKKYREASGLSQAELSKKLKYASPQFVSNWERHLSAPPDRALKNIVKILRIPQAELEKALWDDVMGITVSRLKRTYKAAGFKGIN